MQRQTRQHEVEVGIANVGFGDQSRRVCDDVLILLETDLVEVRALVKQFGASGILALCLSGTLGIRYHGAYNIPIELYIVPGYPSVAPRLQVVPTENMQLRANHDNVDSNGILHCEYLDNWHARTSTLTELCAIASSFFSASPPLFARPSKPKIQEEPPPAYDTIHTHPSPETNHTNESSKERLTTKLQQRLRSFFEKERKAIDLELTTQAYLEEYLEDTKIEEMDIAGLNQATARVQAKTAELKAWLEPRIDSEKPKVTCTDVVSKQLLSALAESTAIEDLLYALDEFLYQGIIDLDIFLREVRRLSNAQFKLKAIMKLIHVLLDDIEAQ